MSPIGADGNFLQETDIISYGQSLADFIFRNNVVFERLSVSVIKFLFNYDRMKVINW